MRYEWTWSKKKKTGIITRTLAATQIMKAGNHPTPEAIATGIPPLNSEIGKRLRRMPLVNPSISFNQVLSSINPIEVVLQRKSNVYDQSEEA